jgi:hypothetical protein
MSDGEQQRVRRNPPYFESPLRLGDGQNFGAHWKIVLLLEVSWQGLFCWDAIF